MARSIEDLLTRDIVQEDDSVASALGKVKLVGPNADDNEIPIYLTYEEVVELVDAYTTDMPEGMTPAGKAIRRIAHQLKAHPAYDELLQEYNDIKNAVVQGENEVEIDSDENSE